MMSDPGWDVDAFLLDASRPVGGWHVDVEASREWSETVTASAFESQLRSIWGRYGADCG